MKSLFAIIFSVIIFGFIGSAMNIDLSADNETVNPNPEWVKVCSKTAIGPIFLVMSPSKTGETHFVSVDGGAPEKYMGQSFDSLTEKIILLDREGQEIGTVNCNFRELVL